MKNYLASFTSRVVVGLCSLALLLSTVQAEAAKKVLVVSVTTSFRHTGSIEVGQKVVAQLAKESGAFTVDFVQQPPNEPKAPNKPKAGEDDAAYKEAQKKYNAEHAEWMKEVVKALLPLSPENLKNYDAVMFLNTTGDLPLPDKQGFIDWIKAGHGFIGTHSATDTLHNFRPYIEMIGGEFKTHGAQVSVDCLNQDPAHSATKHLPASWTVFDEIYQMKTFDRSTVHGLLGLDKHPNDKTPGDYPVAWCKQVGQGKVFYTSLGHREDIWEPNTPEKFKRQNSKEIAEAYQLHLLNGIKWALGLVPGDATPQTAK